MLRRRILTSYILLFYDSSKNVDYEYGSTVVRNKFLVVGCDN
jgi:hypothetical protein